MGNITKLRRFLQDNGYEGILLRQTYNFSWLTNGAYNYIVRNIEQGVADLLVQQEKIYVIVDETECSRIIEEELKNAPFTYEVVTCKWYEDKNEEVRRLIKDKNVVSDCVFDHLLVVDDALAAYRSILNKEEIERFRLLCQESATIVETICKHIERGMTEHEIESLLVAACITKDIRPHVMLVSSDERLYKYRHPIPTHKKVEKQVMVVLCGERHGLVANVTRLVHFGELTEQLIENQRKVAIISAVMMKSTKAGTRVGDVLLAGIKEYEKAGYGEDWKILHQGGLAGYKTREYLVTPNHNNMIQHNQVYAWNPMISGVKCEDTFLVKEDGLEILTHTGNWIYEEVAGLLRPGILVK
ncbi:MAG: M24 family metallopeptidase [Bacillaceae bacterium]